MTPAPRNASKPLISSLQYRVLQGSLYEAQLQECDFFPMTLFCDSESLLEIGAEVFQLCLILFFDFLPLLSEFLFQSLNVINPR